MERKWSSPPVPPFPKVEMGETVEMRVEIAPQAGANTITQGAFPISEEPAETGKTSTKPAVSEEKLEMIRRMKEKKFPDHEIATLVGLAGRKYGLYRQCLGYLGYGQTKEG